jgi:hypothetical protein
VHRDTEINGSPAAVDDCGSADHLCSRRLRDVNRLAGRFAGREDIFDHQHAIVTRERESTSQGERSAPRAFREDRADAKRPRHFMSDDQSAESRREND